MNSTQKSIIRTYVLLTLSSTLAASFIWGVNTLFLLDAGLSNLQAFTANAFFLVGQVVFEIPTGVIADMWGRRTSYLLGVVTLFVSTWLYLFLWQSGGSFALWALASAMIGFGFTFFSGATEAWVVDALAHHNFKGNLESVFAKAQVAGGGAMLVGSVTGGVVAQTTNLGVPYLLRIIMLVVTFFVAYFLMHDIGFIPKRTRHPLRDMKKIVHASIENSFKNRTVRWLMLASPFSLGAGIFAFYALQPYLLELYGNPEAYGVAGLAAAIVAGAQIAGGLSVSAIRKAFKKRTSVMIFTTLVSIVIMIIVGFVSNFWIVLALIVIWALMFAAAKPVRQACINSAISSDQRATVLSFDALVGSMGGVVSQPSLGRVSDVWGYGTAYVITGVIQIGALPFLLLARRQKSSSDKIVK